MTNPDIPDRILMAQAPYICHMKNWLATLAIGILLLGCKENRRKTSSSLKRTDSTVSSEVSLDKAQTPTQIESTQSTEVAQERPRPRLNSITCMKIEKNLNNLSFPYKVEIDLGNLSQLTPFSSEI